MTTGYTLELIEPEDDISFGSGDGFWKDLVTKLWTKRGELWSYPQDAYGVGAIVVTQDDAGVLGTIDRSEARFVIDILTRIEGSVLITRHP